MAKRQQLPSGEELCRVMQTATQLHPFILPNVRPTGRQLGGGSYGTVEELEINGLICAGKKIYDALIDPMNRGSQRIVAKYYNECSLLSDMRHPNIVQFLGICFLPESRLPVLVMERMHVSLDDLLENTANIPFSTKVSVLQDVARGLVYLHNHHPPVIHRDLSSRNVLLDAAMTAKIADLGNSRIADISPDHLSQSMSQGPGTLVYMPPEALDSTPRYGAPLDMFSFGHLALFTAIQVYPGDLLAHSYYDPQSNQLRARTEIQRREQYISMLHAKFGKPHPLVALIKSCLAYEPEKRPTAIQALERLGGIKATVRDPYTDLNRLQLEKSLAEKEIEAEQIPQLRHQLEQLTTQKTKQEKDNKTKDEVLAEKGEVLAEKDELLVESQLEQLADRDSLTDGRPSDVAELHQQLQLGERERKSLVEQLERERREKERHQEQLERERAESERERREKEEQVRIKEAQLSQIQRELQVQRQEMVSHPSGQKEVLKHMHDLQQQHLKTHRELKDIKQEQVKARRDGQERDQKLEDIKKEQLRAKRTELERDEELAGIRLEQLRTRRAQLERDQQLDHIEEQVTEANDRQLTKWRAEQHRDDKQMEQVEQVDGRLRQVSREVKSLVCQECKKTRKRIKNLEGVVRDSSQPPPPPSNDSSPDSPPPDVQNMFS